MTKSKIEWTGHSWNPIVGCTIKSPGCKHCYAMTMAGRLQAMGHASYQGLTEQAKTGAVWTGKLALNEKALLEPLKRKKPTTYFVNSMGDLFHGDCLDWRLDRVFAVMALCPQHTFQVLTKRANRMREYCSKRCEYPQPIITAASRMDSIGAAKLNADYHIAKIEVMPLPNVWLGVSVEDQKRADERIPDLLATPAAVRFLSCEPLLGPVDLFHVRDQPNLTFKATSRKLGLSYNGEAVDWVIAGGESGPKARPMHPDWARGLRDQCADAGVPFFFKQWGEWKLYDWQRDGFDTERLVTTHVKQSGCHSGAENLMVRVGKKKAGRLLDEVQHDGVPA